MWCFIFMGFGVLFFFRVPCEGSIRVPYIKVSGFSLALGLGVQG